MKKLFILMALGLIAASAWAVPANPRPMPYVQPDGDTLMIRLVGDEHFHYNTTVDRILIAKDSKGYFCYATWRWMKDGDGQLWRTSVPTKKRAHNEADRSASEQRWLNRLQKKSEKRDAKEEARAEKEAAKMAKVAAKKADIQAKKDAKEAEKQAEKDAKKAKKEAKKAEK